ncbi:MAG TPA: aminotransferase class IV [Reyranella sp.]
MTRMVHISGELVPENEARISIFDSAIMLADTVTESTRTFGHTPFKLDEHIERLFLSMKLTRIDPRMSVAEMKRITLGVLESNLSNYAAHEDCWIVHNISRGLSVAGADPTKQLGAPTVMIFTQPMDLRSWVNFYSTGCHAVTPMSRMVPSQSLDPRIKNRSRLPYTLAEMEVKLVDPLAQSVILDLDGHVAENKGGNIFAVKDGVLKTPSTVNCLAGVSRATALELAQKLGIPTAETTLLPYDLATADEVFFTSTPYCIMPATKFNGLPVGDGKVGPVAKRLLAAWSDLVGLDIVGQAQAQLK